MSNPATSLPPGFRFHPTDEELILHYLQNRATSLSCPVSIIADVDIYKFDPWDLPAKAIFGEREWYFFTHRDRKYPNGVRPNRAAVSGYWKATGRDKHIVTSKGNESVGVKKALVFYKGRPPSGVKTCWIMHEYCLTRAETKPTKFQKFSMRLGDLVLCRIYKKTSHLRPMNRGQEDSVGEDLYMSSLPTTTQLSSTKLQKSCSFSELLDAIDYPSLSSLFDSTSGSPEFKQGSLGDASLSQPLINNSNKSSASSYQQLSRKESHVMDVCFEEDGGLKQSNPCILSDYTNQDDSMQNSLLSQTPFNQNWRLNSHWGLHGGHI